MTRPSLAAWEQPQGAHISCLNPNPLSLSVCVCVCVQKVCENHVKIMYVYVKSVCVQLYIKSAYFYTQCSYAHKTKWTFLIVSLIQLL